MEKQSNLAYIKREEKQSSPNILKETFKIIIRNGRLSLFITLIMFSFYALKGLADYLLLEPVVEDFLARIQLFPKTGRTTDADPTLFKAILKDTKYFLIYLIVVSSFSCLVLIFSIAASVHSTYEAYTAKQLSLKEMLYGIKGRLKRPLITTIWMILISFASAAFFYFTIGAVGLMTESYTLTPLSSSLFFLFALYYVYILALWMVSLVVSVVEENLSGLKAIFEANELMKGKRLRAYGLMMLMMLFSFALHITFACLVSMVATQKAMVLAINVPEIWSLCLMKLFVFVVFTLFYHECKNSHKMEENPNLYAPVSATDQV